MQQAITIINDGPRIGETTYWESEHAAAGLFYLSWNAGAGRVLIPEGQTGILPELTGADEVIVSRGPWPAHGNHDALELLWEDGSDSPFCIHLVAEQCDRVIPESEQGGGFVVTVWTQDGVQGEWPGRYRQVPTIPYLKPWEAQ